MTHTNTHNKCTLCKSSKLFEHDESEKATSVYCLPEVLGMSSSVVSSILVFPLALARYVSAERSKRYYKHCAYKRSPHYLFEKMKFKNYKGDSDMYHLCIFCGRFSKPASICVYNTFSHIRPLEYLILKRKGADAFITSILWLILFPVSFVALNKFFQMRPLIQISIKLE